MELDEFIDQINAIAEGGESPQDIINSVFSLIKEFPETLEYRVCWDEVTKRMRPCKDGEVPTMPLPS